MGKSFVVSLLLLACTSSTAADTGAQAVFDRLKSLAGNWHGTSTPTRVEYKVIANGSTLIESWTMSPTRQSMTVYTMDGERLLATHYCPQGNAPRMAYTHTDAEGAAHFLFVDGANLQDPVGAHEHAFWVRIDAPASITRSETYIQNDAKYEPAKDHGEQESFVRD